MRMCSKLQLGRLYLIYNLCLFDLLDLQKSSVVKLKPLTPGDVEQLQSQCRQFGGLSSSDLITRGCVSEKRLARPHTSAHREPGQSVLMILPPRCGTAARVKRDGNGDGNTCSATGVTARHPSRGVLVDVAAAEHKQALVLSSADPSGELIKPCYPRDCTGLPGDMLQDRMKRQHALILHLLRQ